jgi:hypothetical protein
LRGLVIPYSDLEKRKEYNRKYYVEHREQDKQRSRIRHQIHKEEDNAKSRAYHQAHKDKQNEIRKKYHQEHYEQHLETCKSWYNKNREYDNQKTREYLTTHKDEQLPKGRARGLGRRIQAMTIIAKGKPKCVNCGCDYLPFLEINHINGNGTQERKNDQAKGSHFCSNIVNGKRSTEDLEITCRLCNALHYLKLYKDSSMAAYFNVSWNVESTLPDGQSQRAENQPVQLLGQELLKQS